MPELPEVEIVKQSLEKTIVSKRIKKFIIFIIFNKFIHSHD